MFAGDDVRRVRREREADPGEPSMLIFVPILSKTLGCLV